MSTYNSKMFRVREIALQKEIDRLKNVDQLWDTRLNNFVFNLDTSRLEIFPHVNVPIKYIFRIKILRCYKIHNSTTTHFYYKNIESRNGKHRKRIDFIQSNSFVPRIVWLWIDIIDSWQYWLILSIKCSYPELQKYQL